MSKKLKVSLVWFYIITLILTIINTKLIASYDRELIIFIVV